MDREAGQEHRHRESHQLPRRREDDCHEGEQNSHLHLDEVPAGQHGFKNPADVADDRRAGNPIRLQRRAGHGLVATPDTPLLLRSRLIPEIGLNSQRQTTPVTMNDSAYGRRNRLRKKPLATNTRCTSSASTSPAATASARNSTVNTTLLRTSAWKRGESASSL